jgi:uncharacterized membrane protein YqjE
MLIVSQVVILILFGFPIFVLSSIGGLSYGDVLLAFLGCVSTIMVGTLVGVAFPPEKDNPFSVFVGLTILIVIMSIIGIMVGVLNLPRPAMWGLLIFAHLFIMVCAIFGIQELEKKRRYEANNLSS